MTRKGKGRQKHGGRSKAEAGRRWQLLRDPRAHAEEWSSAARQAETESCDSRTHASVRTMLRQLRKVSGDDPPQPPPPPLPQPPPPPLLVFEDIVSETLPPATLQELCVDVVARHLSLFACDEAGDEVPQAAASPLCYMPQELVERVSVQASRHRQFTDDNVEFVATPDVERLAVVDVAGRLSDEGLRKLLPFDHGSEARLSEDPAEHEAEAEAEHGEARTPPPDSWEELTPDQGWSNLAAITPGCRGLHTLVLHSPTGLSRALLLDLAHGLPALQSLSLPASFASGDGPASILQVVPTMTELHHLDLSDNSWFESWVLLSLGQRVLAASGLDDCPPVTIDETHLDAAAVAHLRPVKLRVVTCHNTGVTSQGSLSVMKMFMDHQCLLTVNHLTRPRIV